MSSSRNKGLFKFPISTEQTIDELEKARVNLVNLKIRRREEMRGEKLVDPTKKISRLPIVNLKDFDPYNDLVSKYSEMSKALEYQAVKGEMGYTVDKTMSKGDLETKLEALSKRNL